MSIDLNGMTNFKNARNAFASAVTEGKNKDEQNQAFSAMMDALSNDTVDYIDKTVNGKIEPVLNARVKDPDITSEEVDFFNALTSDDTSHKESKEVVLPETTVDKIFEDLAKDHPFMQIIGLQNTGLRLKFLKSEATGAAVWGKLYDGISGQLKATFSDEDANQSKLTAFVAIPNDVKDFGAAWIKTYVMTQIEEAFAAAAEAAFIAGDGKDKPIGLTKSVAKGVSVTDGVYPDKESAGAITLTDTDTAKKELGGIVKTLSVKENGEPYAAKGNIYLVVQPGVSIDLETAMTMQNVNGQWVYALPFGLQVVESQFVPEGKVVAFVPKRYDAYSAGNVAIAEFDQTLALEDATLYTAKRFFYGKAADDNTAKVYDFGGSGK